MARSWDWHIGVGRSSRLNGLLADARRQRRARRRASGPSLNASGDVLRRDRAQMLIERMLSGPLPAYVDCSSYLNRLATRHQVASRMIGTMMTNVQGVVLNAVRARAIAVAIAELFHFLEAGAHQAPVRVCLAVALDEDRLVVGIGVESDVSQVVARRAHCYAQGPSRRRSAANSSGASTEPGRSSA
jgi:hypothetical protein